MRRSRKWNATLDTAQRGEVKHSFVAGVVWGTGPLYAEHHVIENACENNLDLPHLGGKYVK